MTTYTIAQLTTRAIKDLGILGVDETSSSAMLADGEEVVQSEILQMQSRGLPIWNGSVVTIPQEYLSALSRRLGLALGPAYGMFSVADAAAAIIPAEALLRQLSGRPPTGAVQQAEYF